MFHNDGVGLSANQIGIWERAFVMMTDIDLQETITCFNPRILKQSRKKVIMQEGCLSYPDLFLDIERPESVVVKYEDEGCLLYTSPSPRDRTRSRMPSSA